MSFAKMTYMHINTFKKHEATGVVLLCSLVFPLCADVLIQSLATQNKVQSVLIKPVPGLAWGLDGTTPNVNSLACY